MNVLICIKRQFALTPLSQTSGVILLPESGVPFMLMRFALPALAISALVVGATVPALAWNPPSVGTPCAGTRGPGPERAAFAGNYMGGRLIGPAGVRDYKSFQSCFRTEEACTGWLARHATRYPTGPQIATCARVVLR
jgi:hypothetical protein